MKARACNDNAWLGHAKTRRHESGSGHVRRRGDATCLCIRSKITESVILSDKRLTYEQAGLFLKENDLEAIKSAKPPPSRYSGNPGKTLDEISNTLLKNLQLNILTYSTYHFLNFPTYIFRHGTAHFCLIARTRKKTGRHSFSQ